MTGHYEKFFFSVKFALDLGVIKTKLVSFSKKLFLLSLLVSITQPGFSLFTEHDLERPLVHTNGYLKMLPFFPALKRQLQLCIDLAIARSIHQGLSLRFPCNDLTLS